MSFLEFMGIAFIGFLLDEFVRYGMEETSIFSHKRSNQTELHNHYNYK